MYKRRLQLRKLLQHRSLFLLGPRQTGKSTLLLNEFPNAKYFNLLEADTFRQLASHPELIRQTLTPQDKLVIIDEVQKLPALLDEVHLLIERNKQLRFLLTGSSARKLRRGSANLLAGRAWFCHLHPLVSAEVSDTQLLHRLNRGSLPAMLDSKLPEEDLKAYVGTYLQEEIKAEGLSRSIENFSRFLEVASLGNGEQLNFTSIANDSAVPQRTIREYYKILEDTLVGYQLPAYQKTVKRKPMATSKFYLFDLGVANTLMRRAEIRAGSELFGRAMEHLVFLELKAYLDYQRLDLPLTYWRSLSQMEVDFVIGDAVAIEVKMRPRIAAADLKGLMALHEEVPLKRRIVVAAESRYRRTDNGTEVIPYQQFFRDLWLDKIIA